jgi:hypothetical protein
MQTKNLYRPFYNTMVKTATICIVAFCVVSALLFWKADPFYLRAPSDQELIALYREHRSAFAELKHMAAEDAKSMGYFNAGDLTKLPVLRQQEYKRLIHEIHPCTGISIWQIGIGPDNAVRFEAASGGLLAIGPEWSKGIEYIPDDYKNHGARLLHSLDNPGTLSEGIYLREVEPNWYIYYNDM